MKPNNPHRNESPASKSRFRPIDRITAYLLPHSVEDWLPEDHLARFVVEAMEKLDLKDLARAYAGRGSGAYHPEVMLMGFRQFLLRGLEKVEGEWNLVCLTWDLNACSPCASRSAAGI